MIHCGVTNGQTFSNYSPCPDLVSLWNSFDSPAPKCGIDLWLPSHSCICIYIYIWYAHLETNKNWHKLPRPKSAANPQLASGTRDWELPYVKRGCDFFAFCCLCSDIGHVQLCFGVNALKILAKKWVSEWASEECRMWRSSHLAASHLTRSGWCLARLVEFVSVSWELFQRVNWKRGAGRSDGLRKLAGKRKCCKYWESNQQTASKQPETSNKQTRDDATATATATFVSVLQLAWVSIEHSPWSLLLKG